MFLSNVSNADFTYVRGPRSSYFFLITSVSLLLSLALESFDFDLEKNLKQKTKKADDLSSAFCWNYFSNYGWYPLGSQRIPMSTQAINVTIIDIGNEKIRKVRKLTPDVGCRSSIWFLNMIFGTVPIRLAPPPIHAPEVMAKRKAFFDFFH